MSEISKPNYELTPEGLRNRLEAIHIDFQELIEPDTFHRDRNSLILDAASGERLIIDKAVGSQPEGGFFQDLNMSIHQGDNPEFEARQVDFNFNEFGDGELRKRVISGNENGVERITPNTSKEGIDYLSLLSLFHASEMRENLKLEQEFGVNNQPATTEEIAEAMNYLDGATVLDPTTHTPVGRVDFN